MSAKNTANTEGSTHGLIVGTCAKLNLVVLKLCVLCTTGNVAMVQSGSDRDDLLRKRDTEVVDVVQRGAGASSTAHDLEDCSLHVR